jgi:rubrerythrin
MDDRQFKELLLQALEHERGGTKIYQAAIECAENEDLRKEWTKYLGETRNHVQILEGVFGTLGLDTGEQSPGRHIVGALGNALLEAIQKARDGNDRAAAQIVAAECVVLAETKDHLNWELLGECAAKLKGDGKKALTEAYDEVEDQEDEHLYHTKGWCRELWMDALGMKAVMPPPEERRHVKTAIGAARAEHSRKH